MTNSYLLLAWENSQHLAMLPLVSLPNHVWETSAEIPYWWHVITHIWVVLLIGCAAWEIQFNQSEALIYPDLGRDASSVLHCTMRSLYSSFLNLPYLLILELIIMSFFCKVYYAKFPPGMEQRRVLLMYPLLSKLWLNLHYIIIFFIRIHFHELYQGSPTGFLGSRMWPF